VFKFSDLANLQMSEAQIGAFLQRVEKREGGCWIWLGRRTTNGYGRFYLNGYGDLRTNRLSYCHFKGNPGNQLVCHRCDNPLCVNPGHLFLGDHSINALDASNKGRLKFWGRDAEYCKRGHPFSGDNLRILSRWNAKRECRECAKLRIQKHDAKRSEMRRLRRLAEAAKGGGE
jgi:hypothetical protein